MPRRYIGRAGLVLGGFAAGLLVVLLVAYGYFRAVTDPGLAESVLERVDLPPEVLQLEAIEGDSIARVAVRDVELRGAAGEVIAAAPLVRLVVDLASLAGDGPIELREVLLSEPYLNFVQYANGETNLSEVVAITAGGEAVEADAGGAAVVIRDLRIAEGQVVWASPYAPDSLAAEPVDDGGLQLTRIGGTLMRVRSVQDLSLWVPLARVGGEEGWRVEVAAATALLTDPEVRIVALAGWAEEAPDEGIAFAVETLRTQGSSLAASGVVRLGGETPEFQVEAVADPLSLADLRWLAPVVPEAGLVEGTFALGSRPGGRIEVTGEDLVLTGYDSRIAGRFSALVGGAEPASFWNTELTLDPLRIETLEALGLTAAAPYAGEVRGTVSSDAATVGEASQLQVDLAATFAPDEGGVPTSTVYLRGPLTVGEPEAIVAFDGVEVAFQPLHLAALRPLAPEQAERLVGELRGSATLRGTPAELRVEGGDLAYEVGDARSRLTGLTLDVSTQPELSFTLEARAEPLALATISELFPAFPFRTATFAGPIRVEGTADLLTLDLELSGAAGLIALAGTVAPGDPLRFDLSGRVASFNTQAVLMRPGPLEGPVTGTFAAAGSMDDFRFNVALVQENRAPAAELTSGSFALEGTFRRVAGEPVVQVTGTVEEFNLGTLIGRPALFPSRLTGELSLMGGGREPYRFDVDLEGEVGALVLAGSFAPGDVPAYDVAGRVEGLNLRQLPGAEALPATDLNATIDFAGQGTTLETLAGDFRVDASASTIAGRPLDALRADLSVRDGVAVVDTLIAALAGTRLTAAGSWGLTRPVTDPLAFRLVSDDLSRLAPFLPTEQGVEPQISGSVAVAGTVSGSVRVPVVDVAFEGENLRYEAWRARDLQFDLAATLGQSIEEVAGELGLTGSGLELGGLTTLASVEVSLDGGGPEVAVRAAAVRDDQTSVQLAGLLEMNGSTPIGLLLDSLDVEAGEELAWELTAPARIRWGGVEGVLVDDLNLRSVGAEGGVIAVDGTLPPTGTADLRMTVRGLDLAIVEALLPSAPPIAGTVTLDAVLEGPVTDPELTLDGRVTNLVFQEVTADSIALGGRYDERVFAVNAAAWIAGASVARAEADVPMLLAFDQSLPRFELLREEPLRALLVADSLPIALVATAIPDVENPTGVISSEVTAAGTLDRPLLQGWARVGDGAATFTELGIRYSGIGGQLSFDGEVVRLDSLVVRSDGLATAEGTIRLTDLESPELFLTARMEGFHAIQNEDIADLTLSGQVSLSGRMPRPILTGAVVVDQGTIYFPDFGAPAPIELTEIDLTDLAADTALAVAVGPGFVENVQISDLSVTLESGVWMEAPTARVEIRGELVVFRSGPDMRLYGNLEAVRGTYALTIGPIVREFDVTGGTVRFLGTSDLVPELDITAAHEVRTAGGAGGPTNLTIVVRVTGTAEYPRVTLTSDTRPPLPESELLNYLVFGQPSFRLSQQQGFAQQLLFQEIFGGLLVQELAQLGLPCEYLRLRGRPTELALGSPLAGFGSTSVECGVQVFTDVFLTLETGITSAVNPSNPFNALLGVSLDWEATESLSTRVAREPVRTGLGSLFQSSDVPYQWSADVNGRWEFAFPDDGGVDLLPAVPEERLPGAVPAPADSPPAAPPP